MRPIIGNKLAFCVGFFARMYETKHNTNGPFLLRDRKKVSIGTLFKKVCLDWKLSQRINRRGGWNKNVLGGKKMKNFLAGGASIRH